MHANYTSCPGCGRLFLLSDPVEMDEFALHDCDEDDFAAHCEGYQ